MEESQLSQINGEEGGDEFYEKIEAPKFVDFTIPDQCRPDDRYWFCLRVGCDQKHEEELDSEAIYKNFVLRVMAARSPNIRLRKALNRKPPSSSLKCPLTAPAKPSKSRISRLAVISSISQKIVDAKDKTRPPSKITATPKANSKQSSAAAKAFTTPRNRKRISNPDTFKSVRNPKPTNLVVPKTRVIAKALVFHSPKKVCKIKTSLEVKTSMRKLCAAMSKLEIASGKKQTCNKPLPLDATLRKQFRGREVKSRVYDSLLYHTHKGKEDKPLKNMKRKKKEDELKHFVPQEGDENDSSDMEIDEKSRDGSLEGCSVSGTSTNGETHGQEVCVNNVKTSEPPSDETQVEVLSETSRGGISTSSSSEEDSDKNFQGTTIGRIGKANGETDHAEKAKSCEAEDMENDDKENALPPSNDRENDGEVIESDEKENASASDDKREPNNCSEGKILSKHDTHKVNRVTKKTLKTSSIATTGAQEAKYRKPKPTTPMPFRLRTDERGILKEANMEKKLHTPLNEITPVRPSGMRPLRKYQNLSQNNEKCHEQSENESITRGDSEKKINRTNVDQPGKTRTTCLRTLNHRAPRTCSPSMNHRTQVAAVQTSKKSSERTTKSPIVKKSFARTQGITSSRKTARTVGRLGVIKEKSTTILRNKETKPCENGTSSAAKALGSNGTRSVSRVRRPATIPKEPHFHSIHVPKSCTRKIA